MIEKLETLEPKRTGEPHVADHAIRLQMIDHQLCRFHVVADGDFPPAVREELGNGLSHGRFIFDDQDPVV